MVSGLTFPHLSEHDPPVAGEGSIDPLGLAPASDRLADFVAPHVRNRMRHIRFVTATAVPVRSLTILRQERQAEVR